MGSKIVSGQYVPGLNHSRHRPNLYKYLGMCPGTINIQVPEETDDRILIPTNPVEGQDGFDLNIGQAFLVRRCRLNGVDGYQILPFEKTTNVLKGYHSYKRIEVTLKEWIKIQHGDTLDVELLDFED